MGSIEQWTCFKLIFGFLDSEAETFRDNLLGETLRWTSGIATTLLTLWILLQGYRIATGRSRAPMMALVSGSLHSVLILSAATGMTFASTDLYALCAHGLPAQITYVVTGQAQTPEDLIDKSLNKMQAALTAINALPVLGNEGLKEDKDHAQWFVGVGVAGPSVIGGALLLLYKLALALFVGLGPLFILSLMFEHTKELFGRWLFYGIGTMFSLAVLSFTAAVAMKLVFAVSTAFSAIYLQALAAGSSAQGVSSLAMQQGGVGLIMTVLLIMTPPMAAQFFQGVLGNFSAFSAFGGLGRRRNAAAQLAHHGHEVSPVEETTIPRHRHRIPASTYAVPDQVKQAGSEQERSFLERYPNALASLSGHGGNGDELPERLQRLARENLAPAVDVSLAGMDYADIQRNTIERLDLANLRVNQGQVTFDAEGNDDPASRYYSRHLHWPGGQSGVTLGRGYDLGSRSPETVLNDLTTAGVDERTARRFADAAGLSGLAAREFVRANKDELGEVSRRTQRRLFEDVVYPSYVEDAKSRYSLATAHFQAAPSWDNLDSRVKDVAIDLTYQQGQIFQRQMPLIIANDREKLAQYIETAPDLSQYESGRHRATYLRGD